VSHNIKYFGLLHIKNNENKKLNFNSSSDDQKILVYLKNAILLDKQLKHFNNKFILISNKKNLLNKKLKDLDYNLEIISIKFETHVPKNTHFYSCHFRVDVFRYLSQQKNIYSVLLDLDILVLNNPKKIENFKRKKISLVNDISQNVIPAYGEKKILQKLNIINPKIKKVLWIGGDFFAGNSNFFKLMYKKTVFYQKKFVKNIRYLSNQTDELFMSASINDIKESDLIKIKFANKVNIFDRYWNSNIKHEQKKIEKYKNNIFLHVPADKLFLSRCYNEIKHKQNFKDDYFVYVNNIKNNLKNRISYYLPDKIKEFIKFMIYK